MEQTTSNITVTLNIPNNKVMAQAMDVFDQYTPIVKEALMETKQKLLFDEEYQQELKRYIKDIIEKTMKEGVERAAREVVNDAFYSHYGEIENNVRETVVSRLTKGYTDIEQSKELING